MASSLAYSQVGVNTPNPTNTLDVNGTARVRQIDPGLAATALTPLYADNKNVVVNIPNRGNYSLITNSVNIAAGSGKNLITNLPYGAYRVTVIVGNGCVNTASADFFIHNFNNNNEPTNAYYGLNGQDGFVTRSSTNNYNPSFTQVAQNNVKVTWTGIEVCGDGSNSTAFNYSLVINGSTVSITNNGNIARSYRINATRLD